MYFNKTTKYYRTDDYLIGIESWPIAVDRHESESATQNDANLQSNNLEVYSSKLSTLN